MKGIIIYENDLGAINAVKLKNASFCYESIEDDKTDTLQGTPVTCTSTKCNKEDTYDFEVGALIALMKMCGSDKVVRACNEAFSYEKDLHELRKDFDKVKDLKEFYKKNYEEVKEHYEKLGDRNKYLIEENKNLKKRINELEIYNNQLEDRVAAEQRGGYKFLKDMEKLQHEYDLCKNSENALKCSVDYLNKSIAKLNTAIYGYKEDLYNVSKRCREFEEENEKLKLDCEKLQHGYIDTDMIFCGGRQNGKQYTLLVELFKNLDQKKVDAAYKEAYNTTLPVWQKEVLNQMIEASKYSLPHVHEWLYRIPTKREEMWEKIFDLHKESDVIIKVKKEDVNTFLHEIENKIPEITWASDVKIFETKYTIGDIYEELKTHDTIYFRLSKLNSLSYSSDSHIYPYRDLALIPYLPPMRWDLFKKGRIVVKVNTDNYEDFYNKCEIEIGRKPHYSCKGTFTVYYSKGTFHTRPYDEKIPYKHKVVNWEDVR